MKSPRIRNFPPVSRSAFSLLQESGLFYLQFQGMPHNLKVYPGTFRNSSISARSIPAPERVEISATMYNCSTLQFLTVFANFSAFLRLRCERSTAGAVPRSCLRSSGILPGGLELLQGPSLRAMNLVNPAASSISGGDPRGEN